MAQRSSRHLLRDGRQALDDFPRDPHQAENDRDVANQALQRFRRGPYEAYAVLRDRVAALELMTPSADSYHLALAGA